MYIRSKLVTVDELAHIVSEGKKKGEVFVMTASQFPIIHPGYIDMFAQGKEARPGKEAKLIVALHEDATVERPEKRKPILSLQERIYSLSALQDVDYVVTYRLEKDLLELLKTIRPNIRMIGEDYVDKDFTGKKEGPEWGIETFYNNRYHHGYSSTDFTQYIRDRIKEDDERRATV